MPSSADVLYQDLDYYAVLEVDPTATVDRAARRRSARRSSATTRTAARDGTLATRRTSVLNRAWSELRDPGRRRAYDGALARGDAATVDWPLAPGEPLPAGARTTPTAAPDPRPAGPSPLAPARLAVRGRLPRSDRRVPRQPDGPAAWIVAHYIDGEDWRDHRERYWLRFVAAHYRDRGRTDDWVGVAGAAGRDRSARSRPSSAPTCARPTGHRSASCAGAGFLRGVAMRWAPGSVPRAPGSSASCAPCWRDFRDRTCVRGTDRDQPRRDLLLDYLGQPRAGAHLRRRAGRDHGHVPCGQAGRAAELLDRLLAIPVTEATAGTASSSS